MRPALAQLARGRLGFSNQLLLEHETGVGGRCCDGVAALFLEFGFLYGVIVRRSGTWNAHLWCLLEVVVAAVCFVSCRSRIHQLLALKCVTNKSLRITEAVRTDR